MLLAATNAFHIERYADSALLAGSAGLDDTEAEAEAEGSVDADALGSGDGGESGLLGPHAVSARHTAAAVVPNPNSRVVVPTIDPPWRLRSLRIRIMYTFIPPLLSVAKRAARSRRQLACRKRRPVAQSGTC